MYINWKQMRMSCLIAEINERISMKFGIWLYTLHNVQIQIYTVYWKYFIS
jgi:hypothetical protein